VIKKSQSQAPVISKKISAPSKPDPSKKSDDTKTDTSAKTPSQQRLQKSKSKALEKRIYDPKKQLNPFIPLFRDDDKETSGSNGQKQKKKASAANASRKNKP
jgi:hypothetical protein